MTLDGARNFSDSVLTSITYDLPSASSPPAHCRKVVASSRPAPSFLHPIPGDAKLWGPRDRRVAHLRQQRSQDRLVPIPMQNARDSLRLAQRDAPTSDFQVVQFETVEVEKKGGVSVNGVRHLAWNTVRKGHLQSSAVAASHNNLGGAAHTESDAAAPLNGARCSVCTAGKEVHGSRQAEKRCESLTVRRWREMRVSLLVGDGARGDALVGRGADVVGLLGGCGTGWGNGGVGVGWGGVGCPEHNGLRQAWVGLGAKWLACRHAWSSTTQGAFSENIRGGVQEVHGSTTKPPTSPRYAQHGKLGTRCKAACSCSRPGPVVIKSPELG